MCLGVPGRVVAVDENDLGIRMGSVEFGGVRKEACLAYVPEVAVGDFVLVHVGFAISQIDEREAHRVFETLQEMGDLPAPEDEP
jgi:hydrogenase expression/formation protein HypC